MVARICTHTILFTVYLNRVGAERACLLATRRRRSQCSAVQKDQDAIRVARKILRKDPEFLDVRCALTAFLWAAGETAAAEGEWSTLQAAQGPILARLPVIVLCTRIFLLAAQILSSVTAVAYLCASTVSAFGFLRGAFLHWHSCWPRETPMHRHVWIELRVQAGWVRRCTAR